MKSRAPQSGQSGRRGGVLFEILLSLGIFAGAASFTLAAISSVFTSLDSTRKHQQAVDLARTKMAQLEAGLISMSELRGAIDDDDGHGAWIIDASVQRSEFTGLSLVELTMTENVADIRGDGAPVRFTLRQLVPLLERDVEGYERDELMDEVERE